MTRQRPSAEARRRTSPPRDDPAPVIVRRNLPLMLLQARERVVARFRPLLTTHGVTEQQWRIVRALLDAGPLEPREIVALCGFSGPSLAGVLARMEELGLVARATLARDRRRQLVSLTPKARSLAARLAPRLDEAYASIESLAGTDVMTALCGALDAVVAALPPPEGNAPR